MNRSPLYSEWCTFGYLSKNAIWSFRYGALRVSAGASVNRLALYDDRLVVKFLGITFCKIEISDIRHVEFWTSLYGPRMQIFRKSSSRTVVLSVSEPKRMQEILKNLGVRWILGDEALYQGPDT
jgi:hypothetical protein